MEQHDMVQQRIVQQSMVQYDLVIVGAAWWAWHSLRRSSRAHSR